VELVKDFFRDSYLMLWTNPNYRHLLLLI